MNQSKWQRALIAVVLSSAGVIVGANFTGSNVARGEVRGTPEPPSFQTGDQISVPILREIAATLHQMDARLARLETTAQKMQMTAARRAPVETNETAAVIEEAQ